MTNKEKVYKFIKAHILGVVSTIDSKGGWPESAVVAFSETKDLEIIFGTFNNARKYKNLQSNKNISFVVGWDDNITVQYEGIAQEVSGDELDQCREIHLTKNPKSKKYAFDEKQRFFKVRPVWVKYSDFNHDPEDSFELSFS